MRHRPTIAAIALAFCLPAAALAQAPAAAPAAPQAQAAPAPRAEALVRRYLAASHMEAQIDSLLASMLPVMMEQQARLNPKVTAEDQKMILETTRQVMRDTFTPKLIERAIPIYASTFSESELEGMVAFYESPTGQAVLAKNPLVAQKIAGVTRDLMPEATTAMVQAMCAKMNCLQPTPAPMPKAKPS